MKIGYHQTFLKHFKKRIAPNKKLESKFYQRLNLLIRDPDNPLLKRHQLRGQKRFYWSFSVTGDIRVIYLVFDGFYGNVGRRRFCRPTASSWVVAAKRSCRNLKVDLA